MHLINRSKLMFDGPFHGEIFDTSVSVVVCHWHRRWASGSGRQHLPSRSSQIKAFGGDGCVKASLRISHNGCAWQVMIFNPHLNVLRCSQL
ncbi:hypothetical protein CDAR_8381 [Caerostris darwini]|uniref:Galectin n=1 Tax=Caerostris darwini TaxID=1538125 RepID=A0AAV4WVP9_9ARAC|nr:hypothetical protein CDAR_8381 [Caerostris darwini]